MSYTSTAIRHTIPLHILRPVEIQTISRSIIEYYRALNIDFPFRSKYIPGTNYDGKPLQNPEDAYNITLGHSLTDFSYRVYISEVISQQTQISRTVQIFNLWMAEFPTLQSCFDQIENDRDQFDQRIRRIVQGGGFYQRFANIIQTLTTLSRIHNDNNLNSNQPHNVKESNQKTDSPLPTSYTKLCELKGIGPYVSGAISTFAYGFPIPPIDVNVSRVISRLTGVHPGLMFCVHPDSLVSEHSPPSQSSQPSPKKSHTRPITLGDSDDSDDSDYLEQPAKRSRPNPLNQPQPSPHSAPNTTAPLLINPLSTDIISTSFKLHDDTVTKFIINVAQLFGFTTILSYHRWSGFDSTTYSPKYLVSELFQGIMDLSREVCNDTPKCGICPVKSTCRSAKIIYGMADEKLTPSGQSNNHTSPNMTSQPTNESSFIDQYICDIEDIGDNPAHIDHYANLCKDLETKQAKDRAALFTSFQQEFNSENNNIDNNTNTNTNANKIPNSTFQNKTKNNMRSTTTKVTMLNQLSIDEIDGFMQAHSQHIFPLSKQEQPLDIAQFMTDEERTTFLYPILQQTEPNINDSTLESRPDPFQTLPKHLMSKYILQFYNHYLTNSHPLSETSNQSSGLDNQCYLCGPHIAILPQNLRIHPTSSSPTQTHPKFNINPRHLFPTTTQSFRPLKPNKFHQISLTQIRNATPSSSALLSQLLEQFEPTTIGTLVYLYGDGANVAPPLPSEQNVRNKNPLLKYSPTNAAIHTITTTTATTATTTTTTTTKAPTPRTTTNTKPKSSTPGTDNEKLSHRHNESGPVPKASFDPKLSFFDLNDGSTFFGSSPSAMKQTHSDNITNQKSRSTATSLNQRQLSHLSMICVRPVQFGDQPQTLSSPQLANLHYLPTSPHLSYLIPSGDSIERFQEGVISSEFEILFSRVLPTSNTIDSFMKHLPRLIALLHARDGDHSLSSSSPSLPSSMAYHQVLSSSSSSTQDHSHFSLASLPHDKLTEGELYGVTGHLTGQFILPTVSQSVSMDHDSAGNIFNVFSDFNQTWIPYHQDIHVLAQLSGIERINYNPELQPEDALVKQLKSHFNTLKRSAQGSNSSPSLIPNQSALETSYEAFVKAIHAEHQTDGELLSTPHSIRASPAFLTTIKRNQERRKYVVLSLLPVSRRLQFIYTISFSNNGSNRWLKFIPEVGSRSKNLLAALSQNQKLFQAFIYNIYVNIIYTTVLRQLELIQSYNSLVQRTNGGTFTPYQTFWFKLHRIDPQSAPFHPKNLLYQTSDQFQLTVGPSFSTEVLSKPWSEQNQNQSQSLDTRIEPISIKIGPKWHGITCCQLESHAWMGYLCPNLTSIVSVDESGDTIFTLQCEHMTGTYCPSKALYSQRLHYSTIFFMMKGLLDYRQPLASKTSPNPNDATDRLRNLLLLAKLISTTKLALTPAQELYAQLSLPTAVDSSIGTGEGTDIINAFHAPHAPTHFLKMKNFFDCALQLTSPPSSFLTRETDSFQSYFSQYCPHSGQHSSPMTLACPSYENGMNRMEHLLVQHNEEEDFFSGKNNPQVPKSITPILKPESISQCIAQMPILAPQKTGPDFTGVKNIYHSIVVPMQQPYQYHTSSCSHQLNPLSTRYTAFFNHTGWIPAPPEDVRIQLSTNPSPTPIPHFIINTTPFEINKARSALQRYQKHSDHSIICKELPEMGIVQPPSAYSYPSASPSNSPVPTPTLPCVLSRRFQTWIVAISSPKYYSQVWIPWSYIRHSNLEPQSESLSNNWQCSPPVSQQATTTGQLSIPSQGSLALLSSHTKLLLDHFNKFFTLCLGLVDP